MFIPGDKVLVMGKERLCGTIVGIAAEGLTQGDDQYLVDLADKGVVTVSIKDFIDEGLINQPFSLEFMKLTHGIRFSS